MVEDSTAYNLGTIFFYIFSFSLLAGFMFMIYKYGIDPRKWREKL